jgi:hypothetical protein
LGWYNNAAGTGYPFNFASLVTGNTTLYAKWVVVQNTALSVGSNTGSISYNYTLKYFAFVPLVSQTVTIYTSHTSGDPYLQLFNSSKSQLTYNDDGKGNFDSQISYSVSAGTVYYIGFRSYSSSTSGSGTLYISGTVAPASGGKSVGDVYTSLIGLNVVGNDNYLVKIPSLSGVKSLQTNYANVKVEQILYKSGNELVPYDSYGIMQPNQQASYVFSPTRDYYVVLKNYSSTVYSNTSLSLSDPVTLANNTATSIAASNNITYVKFQTDSVGGKYVLTATGATGNLSFSTVTSDGTPISGTYYLGESYEISLSPNTIYYIGVKDTVAQNLSLKINKSDVAYQWEIIGGPNGSSYTTGKINNSTYELTRGFSYTFKFWINGVVSSNLIFSTPISFRDVNNNYVAYDASFAISNNGVLTIPAESLIDGPGIYVKARYINGTSYDHAIQIIPKFEGKMVLTGTRNNEDLGFSYSVPKYVKSFTYQILPSTTVFTANVSSDGYQSILANYNYYLNYGSVTELTIKIVSITVSTAIGGTASYPTASTCSIVLGNNLFGGGSGTSASPYTISSVRHFNNIKKTASIASYYYKQTTSLAFSGAHDLHTTNFYGTYDGNYNSVTGINYYITATPQHTDIGGLFGINYGTIKNLYLEGLTIDSAVPDHSQESWISVGGVVATNYGLLDGVTLYDSNIKINRMNAHTGGIVGYNMTVGAYYRSANGYNFNVYNCDVNSTTVYSNGYVGGIAGVNWDGKIYDSDCWSGSRVELYQIDANNRAAGGIVGYNYYGRIEYSYNSSTIAFVNPSTADNTSITPYMGKIAGLNYGSYNLVNSNCGGTLDPGSLRLKTNGFLGIGNINQRKYVGAYCDQGIELNNP